MRILGIDPGTTESAWCLLGHDGTLDGFGKEPNDDVLAKFSFPRLYRLVDVVVIETIEPRYGVMMGNETITTAIWIGRFLQAVADRHLPAHLLKRSEILRHLGVVTTRRKGEKVRSADSGMRDALIDRYGGDGGKAVAIGRKASPGPLHGVSKDVWSALAVACCYADQQEADR